MPTKTIYVAAADLPLIDEATELGDGFSAAVIAGLRLFVQQERARHESTLKDGMEQWEVTVVEKGVERTKRFTGRRLARVLARSGDYPVRYDVFLTRKGQIAVHSWNFPEHLQFVERLERHYGPTERPVEDVPNDLQVFAAFDEMKGAVPEKVIEEAGRAMTVSPIEELDI